MTKPSAQRRSTTTAKRQSTEPAKEELSFPFLDLPPELRNTIYEYIAQGSTTEIKKNNNQPAISSWIYKHISNTGAVTLGLPAILQVNQQIRREATGIFSERTSWMTRQQREMKPFVRRLLAEQGTIGQGLCLLLTMTRSCLKTPECLEVFGQARSKGVGLEGLQEALGDQAALLRIEVEGPDGEKLWASDRKGNS